MRVAEATPNLSHPPFGHIGVAEPPTGWPNGGGRATP
jgi:hypothetical protein